MDVKAFLKAGATQINNATKDTKWWILYAIICFIVLLLFIYII